jgi:hypothetical protein
MNQFILRLNVILLFAIAPVMAQERLAIEDFQIPATLAQSLSSADLSNRLRHIVEQYSTRYKIAASERTIQEILQRLQTEYRLGVQPNLNQYDQSIEVEADKVLKPQLSVNQHQLTLSARLLDKKSFSQAAVYQLEIVGHTVTDEALCSFWQQIEPGVSFSTGLCVPKTWECDERRGETCPIRLDGDSVCTVPSQFSDRIPFQTGNCSVNIFTPGPLNEFILKPKNRMTQVVDSLRQHEVCLTLSYSPSRYSIRVKIQCEK